MGKKKSKVTVDDVATVLAKAGLEADVSVAQRWEPPSDTLVLVATGGYPEQFYVKESFDEVLDRLETLGSADAAVIMHVAGRDGDRVLLRTSSIIAVIDLTKE